MSRLFCARLLHSELRERRTRTGTLP
jgi:hypothetical protein